MKQPYRQIQFPGIYYIGYILDSERQVEETDETNNTGFATITVKAPISDDDHGNLVLGGLGDIRRYSWRGYSASEW